jgi:hypothetical protein
MRVYIEYKNQAVGIVQAQMFSWLTWFYIVVCCYGIFFFETWILDQIVMASYSQNWPQRGFLKLRYID